MVLLINLILVSLLFLSYFYAFSYSPWQEEKLWILEFFEIKRQHSGLSIFMCSHSLSSLGEELLVDLGYFLRSFSWRRHLSLYCYFIIMINNQILKSGRKFLVWLLKLTYCLDASAAYKHHIGLYLYFYLVEYSQLEGIVFVLPLLGFYL